MIRPNDPLCYFIISQNKETKDFWHNIRKISNSGGKFMLDMSMLEKNSYVSRNGSEWSTGWPTKIRPKYLMPAYDKNFNTSHEEITNNRARDVQKLIVDKNSEFAVAYSGGIDSTMVVAALIKNLTKEQLKNVYIYCNSASIMENPIFYKKFIMGKFKLINSSKYQYEHIIEQNINIISSCSADVLYGSKNILDLQSNLYFYTKELNTVSKRNIFNLWKKANDSGTHYSNFKDLIINYYTINDCPGLGESYYDKLVHNINTSDVPVNSLFDFYWWHLFNLKYIYISAKSLVTDNSQMDYSILEKFIFDWYCTDDYQNWSMVNNDSGEKINFHSTTLKMCARRYIYDLDKNDWYYNFKQKISSNEHLKVRNRSQWQNHSPMTKFGISSQLERLYINDEPIKDYISHHMSQFERDW
jgi:hypothetical protein